MFVKHKAQKLFGIILLHNHFPLDDNKILVNIGPVAVPWETPSLAEQLRNVRGSAWRFTEQGIAPYELPTMCPRNLISAAFGHSFLNADHTR